MTYAEEGHTTTHKTFYKISKYVSNIFEPIYRRKEDIYIKKKLQKNKKE
jgi:hypothetical protein